MRIFFLKRRITQKYVFTRIFKKKRESRRNMYSAKIASLPDWLLCFYLIGYLYSYRLATEERKVIYIYSTSDS